MNDDEEYDDGSLLMNTVNEAYERVIRFGDQMRVIEQQHGYQPGDIYQGPTSQTEPILNDIEQPVRKIPPKKVR